MLLGIYQYVHCFFYLTFIVFTLCPDIQNVSFFQLRKIFLSISLQMLSLSNVYFLKKLTRYGISIKICKSIEHNESLEVYLHVLTFFYANIIKHNFPQFFLYFKKEYNYFTILCQFLMYNSKNHLNVYIYPLSLGPTFHPSHPTFQGHHSWLSFPSFTAGPHQLPVLHVEVYIC